MIKFCHSYKNGLFTEMSGRSNRKIGDCNGLDFILVRQSVLTVVVLMYSEMLKLNVRQFHGRKEKPVGK